MGALAVLLLLAAAGPSAEERVIAGSGSTAPFPQPNVLEVVVDDLDRPLLDTMLGYNLLPNWAALKASGVSFDRHFTVNSVCAPSRAALLTGRYSHNNGVACNSANCVGGGLGSITAFNHANSQWAWLRAGGYRIGHFGKDINGRGSVPGAPADSPLNPTSVPPEFAPPSTWQGTVDPYTYRAYGTRVNADGVLVQYGTGLADHQTRMLSGRAATWIAANKAAAPLWVYLAPVAPHVTGDYRLGTPTGAYSDIWLGVSFPDLRDAMWHPQAWQTAGTMPFYPAEKPTFNHPSTITALARPAMSSTDIGRAATQYRYRMLSMLAVDDALGQAIAAFGADQNLWVIVTSDNGRKHGERALAEKQLAFLEDSLVPLVIRGPACGPGVTGACVVPGLHNLDLTLNTDVAPTIAEIAGVTPGAVVDGRSLVPLLKGEVVTLWRKRAAIRHWKAIAGPEWDLFDFARYDALITASTDELPNRLYVEWPESGECELYADAAQATNVCEARPAEVAILAPLLASLRACAGQDCAAAEQ